MLTTSSHPRLSDLEDIKSDSLLALIALANSDPREDKIDVGVGVYKDGTGATPILRAVKVAEKLLWERQESKSYLGGRGDVEFPKLIGQFLLGPHAGDPRIDGLQTPGGCGALSLAFKLINAANPQARVLVGVPTWPNHEPIVTGVGLELHAYPYYDREARSIRFDAMMKALSSARAGDIALLHGCCHNPTGADLSAAQWAEVTRVVVERNLLPVVDIAYQGLGDGLDEDAAGLRRILDACDEVLVAQSCDKNFGVYRDRVGTLFIKTASAESTARAMAHVLQIAREMWSMPPDHGAAAVRVVLQDPALKADWLAELGEMRARIKRIRSAISAAHPGLAYIGEQKGMFSMLPISRDQVLKLREDHGIYMADSGRFNVLGMADDAVDRFTQAIVAVIG
ncbi:aspartate/tyrosine/aromatic aminotransferase [Sphingomonas sp. HDW15A]|uniref:amino acid aminotransferase n=1 Tax=Sphingomonas sp. HDW15A TaxID=2714942 RepID=UPI001409C0EF|nr:amino acid aminotransferase [Sphingomonas sp. HDW15A]QIK95603.1 aspartate/tyrosine/aromatic aminotransferase [Sphingomonas sp. HDW15A]